MNKLKKLLTICLLISSGSLMAQEIDAKVYGKGTLNKNKRIYIADLNVQQYVQTSIQQTGGNAVAGMKVNFKGIDGAAYQAMLSEVYIEIAKKFTALGYTVLENDEIKSKQEEATMFTAPGRSEKMVSNTVTGIVVRPNNALLSPGNILGLHYRKVAKSVDAQAFNFNYSVNTVSFQKGSRFSSSANVSGSPYLSVSGFVSAVTGDAKGGATVYIKSFGTDDMRWVGPKELYKTGEMDLEWMGVSRGTYTLDINQTEYLDALKKMLLTASLKTIENFHSQLQ